MLENHKEYDVCIIGSGPAGAFAAYEIAKSGIKVALVEAGGKKLDVRTNNVLDVESSNIKGKINFGFSQQIGGSSNLWSGGLAQFNIIDMMERKKFGFEGWPIDMKELESLYRRVDKIIGISDLDTDQTIINRDVHRYLNSSIEAREMMVLNKPFCTSNLIENIKGVKLFSKCMVSKLNVKKNKVSEIEVFDINKKRQFSLVAKKYILAAGALTNIRLMLYSLENYKNQFYDLYKNIGLHFSTHPKANVGHIKLFKSLPPDHPFLKYKKYNNHTSRLQFGLSNKVLLENNLLNHCIRLNTSFNSKLNKIFDLIKLKISNSFFFKSGRGYITQKIAKIGISIYKILNETIFFGKNNNLLTVRVFMDQSASEKNRVELSNNVSKSGLPLASIKWNFDEKDWSNVDQFMNLFAKEIKLLGIGELIYQRPSEKEFNAIHSHFLGGTRCGIDKKNSVTDHNLKVHDFENLYISGPSVFPSYGYTNPFYTIAALSLRLADHIISLSKK